VSRGVVSYIQVAPDSTGKKVANVQLRVVAADGSEHTVEAQAVVLLDPDGTPVSPDTRRVEDLLLKILDALETLTTLVSETCALDLKQSLVKKGERQFTFSDREGRR
jgi:DNA polymerase II small subunit/DNA polymerase delta subunit B